MKKLAESRRRLWLGALSLLVVAAVCALAVFLLGSQAGTAWSGLLAVLPAAYALGLLSALGLLTFLGLSLLQKDGKREDAPLQKLHNRLQLIKEGDCNVYLEYPLQDDAKPLVDAVNFLTRERSEMVRTLQNERKKAAYILDNMDSGLLLIDRGMVIRQCNTSAYKYLNFPEELVGAMAAWACPDPAFLRAVKNAVEKEISSVLDLDLTDASGVIVSARVNPISGAWMGEEGAVSAVAILQNVTQARQMERMRSEFVANVSHELKTPITSIKGFTELLLSGMVDDPKTVEGYLGRIHEESQRMTSLIEDILRLSSLEGKEVEERHELVELLPLCQDIFYSLTPQMNSRGITGQVKGHAFFYAYPDDLRQLLKNLIENGIKYNVKGGSVTVRLSCDAFHCTITVSDTGIGIPIEHQPRIFERFYRVDKARSKREGGTGLGLSIVKHIVAKYHGQLTLTSRVDVGTTIKAILPVDGGAEKELE